MKKYLILVLIVLLIGALVIGVLAAKPGNVPHGPAGGSNIAHAYLYEKDENWDIVEGGAWGKMKYNLSGSEFDFVFNGHGLEPETDYTLIYYPESWPDVICLGNETTDDEGNVHIEDSIEIDTHLPACDDPNTFDDDTPGAKIWLVLSDDVVGSVMTGWNPAEYLFEYDKITFDDTDEEPCE
jgi:hypothetical protein